jgi:hypothetical protein
LFTNKALAKCEDNIEIHFALILASFKACQLFEKMHLLSLDKTNRLFFGSPKKQFPAKCRESFLSRREHLNPSIKDPFISGVLFNNSVEMARFNRFLKSPFEYADVYLCFSKPKLEI